MVAIGSLLAVAAAIPLVAFGIVPLFVRSTLIEPPRGVATSASSPDPAAAAASQIPKSPVLNGELARIDAGHYGSGRVTISGPAGSRVLRFEQVEIAGAPNMFVYLSDRTDGQPGRFIDLGPLKATNGSVNYAIPIDLDLTEVRSVVVWCRAFGVTVTFARLRQVDG